MIDKQKKKAISPKKRKVRDHILECALEVFGKYGIYRTSISDIGRRAELADGTIYLYFSNKDELMMYTVDKAIAILIDEIEKILEKIDNPLLKFYAFFDANIAIFTRRPELARFLVLDLFRVEKVSFHDPAFSGYRNYIAYVRGICEKAIEMGYIREVNSEILAHQCHSMVDYLVRLWVMTDYELDMNLLKNKMLEVVVYGLLP